VNDEPIQTATPWWPDQRDVGHPLQKEIDHERQHPIGATGPIPKESIMTPTWEPTRPAAVNVKGLLVHSKPRVEAVVTWTDKFVVSICCFCVVAIVAVLLYIFLEF
jgi:hypothetical protein